jgi:nicotinamide mononucleotide (NMN) deamidase PncC
VAVATTGVAGPAPQEGNDPGVLFVAATSRDGRAMVEHQVVGVPGDEPGILRTRSAAAAGELLLKLIESADDDTHRECRAPGESAV